MEWNRNGVLVLIPTTIKQANTFIKSSNNEASSGDHLNLLRCKCYKDVLDHFA